MGTNVEEVYIYFLNKISDYKMTINPDGSNVVIIKDSLKMFLRSAKTQFLTCRTDLNFIESDNGSLHFKGELDDYEIEILSKLMLVEYLKPVIIRNETVEQALGDSDFAIYSQANHISKLLDLNHTIRAEAHSDMVRYSYAKGGKMYANYK